MSDNNGNHTKSLELWDEFGGNVFPAFGYDDRIIVEARDCIVKDADGNELLDFAAGQFCSTIGHNHPKLIERLTEQMNRQIHTATDFLNPSVLEASAKFAEVAPGNLKKAIFLSTGSEANECALRIAKTATKKSGVVGFTRGYYGISLATQSPTSIKASKTRYDTSPTIPENFRILTPNCSKCSIGAKYPECDFKCLETSLELIGKDIEKVAAFIVEPVVSAGGMVVPPPGYIKQLKALAEAYEALLIADEAQTGFGRTGKWFGIEHHGVVPDILVVAKSSGGGFPVSGLITTDEVAEKALKNGFKHLSSHQSDPLPAAAVSAVIDIIREEGLVERTEKMGNYLRGRLRELGKKWPVIADIRGLGLMTGLVLDNSKLPMIDSMLCRESKTRGVHFNYTSHFESVFRILPPLTVTEAQIDFAVSALDDSLKAIMEGKTSASDLIPKNPYSKAYAERSVGRRTVGGMITKLWGSSPESLVKAVTKKIK